MNHSLPLEVLKMVPTTAPVVEALEKVPGALNKVSGVLEASESILKKTREWVERLQLVFQGEMPEEVMSVHKGLLAKSAALTGVVEQLRGMVGGEEIDAEELEAVEKEIEEEVEEVIASSEAAPGEEAKSDNLLDAYNKGVKDFNGQLTKSQMREMDLLQADLLEELTEENTAELAEDIENYFTPEQKAEIKAYADQLMEEFFPESYVDKAVKFYTEKDELDDMQKVLLAPANGIEGVVTGVWNLFSSPVKSMEDANEAFQSLSGMGYEDFCACARVLKFMYKHMNKEDLVAPAISFIVGCAFIAGGPAQLAKLTKGAKMPGALVKLTGSMSKSTRHTDRFARAKDMPTQLLEEIEYEHLLEGLNDR